MPLPPRRVDLQDVSPKLTGWNLHRFMALVAGSLLEVGSVSEIVQAESRTEGRTVLHPLGLLDVTGSARAELLIGLMVVACVAVRVLRHARFEALIVEPVAEVTFGRAFGHLLRIHLILHLLGVHVIPMRKTLDPELREPRREVDKRGFRGRRLVADHAHLAFQVGKVPRVTFEAGWMSGQHRLGIVGRSHVASCAVLRFGFVLFAVVIERRNYLDYLRVHYVKRRLARRRRRRGSAFGRLVQVLLRAPASPQAGEQNERRHHNCPL